MKHYQDDAEMRKPNVRLACDGDAWSLGLQHPDGSIDTAGLYVHATHCQDCGIYLQAFTLRMSEHDPEPPKLRQEVEQDYYSPRQVGIRLGKSDRTVRRWLRDGVLPYHALWDGRSILIHWPDVEHWLNAVRIEGHR